MRTITITTYASMPSRFKVWHSAAGKRSFGRDALDMIPAELRSKLA